MGKASGVIDANGNQHNVITDQLVGSAKRLVHKAKKSTGFQSIDGFVRGSAVKIDAAGFVAQSPKTVGAAVSRSQLSVRPSAQSVHRGAERTRTLMRSGVRKPVSKLLDRPARVQKSKTGTAQSVQPQRAQKAKSTAQDPRVSHFGDLKALKEPKTVQKAEPATRPVQTRASAAVTAVALPSMVTSASHQQLERLLDHALFRADAHKQALRGRLPGQSFWQRVRFAPRWISAVGVLLIILLLGSFFAWQNIPQVSMKLAAARAHVSASVPAYSPSGFKFAGPISSNNEEVTVRFTANGNPGRSFSVSQKSSGWDSASLLSSYVNPAHHTFQTSQVKGTTVYMYGNSNDATWVSNGIWYTIKDKADLNSDQLLKIADSM